ncbi:pyridoxamine 5'-phosphate oxidase family protein [Halorubraceae archaeon YAN]|nr:pyridoxamine 5'-phosphate oxidase family protein [Halorubraceae archaeon YAN]
MLTMESPSGAWDEVETKTFLTETTVPIRLSCHTPDGQLWMLSLWYALRNGTLHCATSKHADVVRYLQADNRVAFEISTNEPPYMGVRGNGRATIEPDENKTQLRSLIERYLGDTDSALAARLLNPEREEVAITITPHRLYTWDFSDRMADVAAQQR